MRLRPTRTTHHALLLACTLLNLGACTTQDSINATGTSLKRIFVVEPKKPFRPHPVAEAYCYRTQTDILCYREPRKGMEVQYVARQPTESVGVALGANDKVPPSVEEIHRGLPDDGFPPGRVTTGTAAEAARNYPVTPFGRSASFNSSSTNQSVITSSNGSSYVTSASTSVATTKGPRVLMPNN